MNICIFLKNIPPDCVWYGTTFCDGDLVEDLHRWWFRMKCSRSKFSVASVSWSQVVADPRFKPSSK